MYSTHPLPSSSKSVAKCLAVHIFLAPAGACVRAALTTLAVEHYSPWAAAGTSGAARGGLFTTCCPQESAVPKSQVRKKKVYTPPTDVRPAATAASRKPSPVWLPVTAVH